MLKKKKKTLSQCFKFSVTQMQSRGLNGSLFEDKAELLAW